MGQGPGVKGTSYRLRVTGCELRVTILATFPLVTPISFFTPKSALQNPKYHLSFKLQSLLLNLSLQLPMSLVYIKLFVIAGNKAGAVLLFESH